MPGSSVNTDERHLHLVGAPEAEAAALRIRMLSGFRISAGPHAVEANDWKLRKSASLVKLLALQPGNRMHRERVMEILWPSSNAKNAANNLHRALHEARKTLEPSAPSTGHLQLRDEHVVLSPGAELWTDVDAFRDAATVARNTRGCYELDQELLRNAENVDCENNRPTLEFAFLWGFYPSP